MDHRGGALTLSSVWVPRRSSPGGGAPDGGCRVERWWGSSPAPAPGVDERDLGRPAERAHGQVLDVGQVIWRCSPRREASDPGRRRPGPRPDGDRARGARGQAAGPGDREPSARRSRRGAPGGARAFPGRSDARARLPRRLTGRGRARGGRVLGTHRGPVPAGGRRAPGGRRPPRDPVAGPLLVRDRVRREQRRDRRPREPRGGLGPVRDRARGAGATGAARRGRGSARRRPQGAAPRGRDVDRAVLRGRRRGGRSSASARTPTATPSPRCSSGSARPELGCCEPIRRGP